MTASSKESYGTIQSFSSSHPQPLQEDVNVSQAFQYSTGCCSPCGRTLHQSSIAVRPVLCSRQIFSNNSEATCHRGRKGAKAKLEQAWIESAAQHSSCISASHQTHERAQEYMERVDHQRQNKAAKLAEFQKEVKRRVKQMEEKKQRAVLQKNMLDIELERKVARKTAYLAQASMPNASEVMITGRSDFFSKNPSHLSGLHNAQYDEEDRKQIELVHDCVALENSRKQTARQKLMSRKIVRNPVGSDSAADAFWKDASVVVMPDEDAEFGNKENVLETELTGGMERLDLEEEDDDGDQQMTKFHRLHAGAAGREVNCLITSQDNEEVRKQEVKQRAMLRRLYMDIEREQVKEYRKLKKHLDRIAELKNEKEDERRRVELEALVNSARHTTPEAVGLGEQEQRRLEKEKHTRRETETRRYIKALRSLLREKLDRLGITVPPLCSCGDTVWDSHPDRCANNCPFYRNPKGYERALQSLLKSCDSLVY